MAGLDWLVIGGGPSRHAVGLGWGNGAGQVAAANSGVEAAIDAGLRLDAAWLSDPVAVSLYGERIQACQRAGCRVLTARGVCPWADEDVAIERERATAYEQGRWGMCRLSGLMLIQWLLNRCGRPLRLGLAGYDGYGDRWDEALIEPWLTSVERQEGVAVRYAALPMWRTGS